MLVPVFNVSLHQQITPGTLSVGKFDGTHPCIVGASTAGKVFIHNPHYRYSSESVGRLAAGIDSNISLLNINQTITSTTCGHLLPDQQNDILFVGTPTNLMAYDVHKNSDLFYKEVSDGCNSVVCGSLGTLPKPLAIVGGNCSIQGFNADGDDEFWTVTGDNVSAMTLLDFSGDGYNELVVGSEDFDIRVFREDEIYAEMTETQVITDLCPMHETKFGYALSNGTVGVYDRNSRFWRIKSRNQPMSIFGFDVNGDGVPELITGWSNGKIDVRSDHTGEVIYKDNVSSSVSGIVAADYKLSGKDIVVVCSNDGEMKGYQPATGDVVDPNVALAESAAEQDAIRELSQKKQNLLMELQNYSENQKAATLSRPSGLGQLDRKQMGIIPSNTQLQTTLQVNCEGEKPCVELVIGTTNDTIIKSVLIFAEGIFTGESHVIHPPVNALSNSMKVPLFPGKDVPIDLHIKAFVGYKTSEQFHVFELTRQMPKFSMYSLSPTELSPLPEGSVFFRVNDRPQRLVMWINQNFLLTEDYSVEEDLNVHFVCARTKEPLVVQMTVAGEITIRTNSMDLAGDLVQSMAMFSNIQLLQVVADFPADMKILSEILVKVDEYRSSRQQLSAQMADNSNIIKGLIIKAEDGRIMGDMKSMRRSYLDLMNINRQLITEYNIRSSNQAELLKCLKQVNQYIQKAARLRVGQYQTDVVMNCRQALKSSNHSALLKTIKTGSM